MGCDATEQAVEERGLDDEHPVLEVEREVVVDGHEEVLVPVDWMQVSERGLVAVAQEQDHEMRFFDSSGNEVGVVGGEGEGPGEFQSVQRGGWRGDTLWVFDWELDRASFFGPDGEYEGSVSQISAAEDASNENGLELTSLRVHGATGGDTLLASGIRPAEDPDVDYEEEFLVRLYDGSITRVVTQVPPRGEDTVYAITDLGIFPVPFPPLATGHWNVSPDGRRIAVASTDLDGTGETAVHLKVFDDRGDDLLNRDIPFTPEPMDDGTVESLLREAAEPLPGEEPREVFEEEARERLPEFLSPVASVLMGWDERIWLQLRQSEEEAETWLLLDSEGMPSGRLVLEEGETLHATAGDELWVTSLDETDVPSVVRLEIVGGS